MARDNGTEVYGKWYGRLLRLYPKSYQQQFAEPMQQTFGDLCNERKQSSDKIGGFVAGMYAETFVGIIKECTKEVVMNTKSNKSRVLIVVGVGLLIITTVVVLRSNSDDTIGPLSSFEDVKNKPNKKKYACLSDNQQAVDAVRRDDTGLGDNAEFSGFDLAASEGFLDVPAGTYYDITINSYLDNTAKGTISYEKDYGDYNYIIEKDSPEGGKWNFISMVACEK